MISILYVDDESFILDSCKKTLERTGSYAVTTALSGKDALEKIRSSSFDLVISDYQMADINGIDLLKIIRNEFPKMPFIIFTGRGREDVVIEAYEHGVDYYVQKGGDARAQYTDLIHKIECAVENHRIKENLVQSEEKFLSFVRNFDGIAFQINAAGMFFLLEGTVEEITGYRKIEFISGSVSFETMIHPDDKERFHEVLAHLAAVTGSHADPIFRILRKDGHTRWLHGILHNISNGNNNPVYIQGALYDITYLHSAQEELARSEEKWRSIITKAPVIISVLDRHGKILFINKSRPPGKPADLVGTSAGKYFAPENEHLLENALIRVFGTGEYMRFESSVILGETVTEWLSHQISPVSWQGSHEAALMVSTVITERKWLEQNLRDSEEQYRAIVTASGDGIVILDPEGKVTFGSPRMYDIFEIPCDEPLTGMDAMDFIDPAFHLVARSRMSNILSGDLDAEPFEYLLMSRRGNRFLGELVTTPLRDATGAIRNLLVLIRDVSRRNPLPPGRTMDNFSARE